MRARTATIGQFEGRPVEVSEIQIEICRRGTTLSWNPYFIPSWCLRSAHHCWPSDRCCGGSRRRCSAHRKRRACVFLACRLEPTETPGPSRGFNVTPKFRGGGYTCRHIEQPFPDHHKPSRPASRICSWAIRCGSGQCRQKASRSCLLAWRMVRARAQRSRGRVYLN